MANVNVSPQPLGGYNTTTFTNSAIAANAVTWTTGHSPITIFTVIGTVRMWINGVVGATALTSTGGLGTLSLGVAGAITLFLPLSTVSGAGGQFAIASTWVGATPTIGAVTPLLANLTSIVNTGQNVILTVATADMTAGAMTFICNWIPLSAGATVV